MNHILHIIHKIDHFVITSLFGNPFLRDNVLPFWTFWTANVPVVIAIITGISIQEYLLTRIEALSDKWFYMGKAVCVVDPHVCKKILRNPPKEVDKGWIIQTVKPSKFIGRLPFAEPHTKEEWELVSEILNEGLTDESKRNALEYLETLTDYSQIKGTKIMDVYENALFVMYFRNKLTPERRQKLIDSFLRMLQAGIILETLIPVDAITRALGLFAYAKKNREELFNEIVACHDYNLDNPRDAMKAKMFEELFTLNVHAPMTTLGYWVIRKIDQYWDYVKTIDNEPQMWNFYTETMRLRLAPPDIGWEAKEDFFLDYPELGQQIFIPKGYGLTVPTSAINLSPVLNPDPRTPKYNSSERDPKQNYIFGFPLEGADYMATRGCPGNVVAEWLLPKILLKFTALKKKSEAN